MKKNMGSADRSIRLLVAAIIVILYFSNIITGSVGIVLLSLAIIFILTSIVGFCPLYTLFGFNSRKFNSHEIQNHEI
jgi:hypothetical protein